MDTLRKFDRLENLISNQLASLSCLNFKKSRALIVTLIRAEHNIILNT